MNGHDIEKEYGGHKYANHGGTSDCKYHCGCNMGPSSSRGPVGIDPFGKCPGNPKDGKPLGGNRDYEHVVKERIHNLESELWNAKTQLEAVSPSKKALAEENSFLKKELL